jgi:RNA polymerase sigma-70 factor, ECF subfamily
MSDVKRQEEFMELLADCQPRVMACIYAIVHNMQDTEDVYQEACLIMWQRFDSYRAGTSFVKWACSIAYLRVMEHLRKRRNTVHFNEAFISSFAGWESSLPTEETASRVRALYVCMERLSEGDRHLLELRYWEPKTVAEIATELGRTSQSVCNSLGRIRTQLLKCAERIISVEDRA